MAQITLGGNPVNTQGPLPVVGSKAPEFTLTDDSLSNRSLSEFKGQKVVLNIFPSIDTGVCASSVRKFNSDAAGKEGVMVLNISRDMPFAFKRFCGAEGIADTINLSELHDRNFSDSYPVRMVDGGMNGFFSRAVLVVDEEGTIVYAEQVPEIGQAPDYDAALAKL
jgi:thiol peroxidase